MQLTEADKRTLLDTRKKRSHERWLDQQKRRAR